jgi:hypothetical protein
MATNLVSPGVSISVSDESQYGSSGQGTVPLIILATQSNKDNVSGTGYAAGTVPVNAAKPYLLTSQRELVELFGQPKFKTVNGTAVHGAEVNEYGLLAAYSFLGAANRAYVLRADVDLLQLEPTNVEPAGTPATGTYWLDLTHSVWGIFESTGTGKDNWKSVTPLLITGTENTTGGVGLTPLSTLGVNGEYALVATSVVSNYQLYKKVNGAWVIATNAALQSTVFASPHYTIPSASAAGNVWIKTTTPNSGLKLSVKKYNSANFSTPWSIVSSPSYESDAGASAGFGASLVTGKVYVRVLPGAANFELRIYDGSNWIALGEEAKATPVSGATANGTLWYNTSLEVDLYVKANSKWEPVSVPVIIDYSAPASPTPGTLWIDSSDLENYPMVYEFDGSAWVERNITDQTTPNGVLFADLTSTASDTSNAGAATPIDGNAPDPLLHPDGILLWNSIVSTGNVKMYGDVLDGAGIPTGSKAWHSFSGNQADGSPYMLRKAQRRAVVKAMQAVVSSNEQIREEMTYFTLIAAPGYPELADEMLTLNTDRKETGFVIVDTPLRLAPQSSGIIEWITGAKATGAGEAGLVVSGGNPAQAACYYPSGLTTDLSGNNVVVPASHIVLRTMAYNDQVSYPWFAPAGLTRGIVTNASDVGYISAEGEFIPVALTVGQRDTLYGDGSRVGINPIARFPGQGIYVFGQRTLQSFSSALDRVNVARLLAYLRERFDPLARPFIFEPNDKITRANAKQVFDSFLGDMLSKRAIYDFVVVCDEQNNTPAKIDKNELWIDVAIEPVKAAEFIYIPIRVVNTGELSK